MLQHRGPWRGGHLAHLRCANAPAPRVCQPRPSPQPTYQFRHGQVVVWFLPRGQARDSPGTPPALRSSTHFAAAGPQLASLRLPGVAWPPSLLVIPQAELPPSCGAADCARFCLLHAWVLSSWPQCLYALRPHNSRAHLSRVLLSTQTPANKQPSAAHNPSLSLRGPKCDVVTGERRAVPCHIRTLPPALGVARRVLVTKPSGRLPAPNDALGQILAALFTSGAAVQLPSPVPGRPRRARPCLSSSLLPAHH